MKYFNLPSKKSFNLKYITVLLFFTLSVLPAVAAEIKGTVVDKETNAPVIGAVVKIKATSTGVTTNEKGEFTLAVNTFPVSLEVSFLGYNIQTVEVANQQKSIIIYLSEKSQELNELVVVGYGTQKRHELTGSIATVPTAALKQNATSLEQLLGGTVAGVSISQNSGQPGSPSSIRIRGGNSVNAKNDPLYVIDGFIYYSDNTSTKAGLNGIEGNLDPLASINPKDIESIEILKDVSATAIYGSRGANGVIIITTKRGKKNSDNINYQYTIGWSKSAKKIDLLNASQWARIEKDYFNNKGQYTDDKIAALGEGADWQDAVLTNGLTQNHELSISGGGDKTRYLISGNYTDQDGIILNSGFKRAGVRINLDRDVFKNFSVGLNATASKSTQNSLTTFENVNYNDSPYSHGITNSLTYALYMPPVVPIYNSDGSYNYDNPYEYDYLVYDGNTANPVSDLKNTIGQTINSALLGNFYAKYEILSGLVAKINLGTNVSYITQNFYAPSNTALGLSKEGIGGIGNKHNQVTQMEYTLNYNKKLNENNNLEILAGYTYQKTESNYVITTVSGLLTFSNLAAASKIFSPYSSKSESNLHSLLARINYNLLGRYNLTATMRGDKSSRFSEGNRWGYFPSVGLSWNVNKENFFKLFSPVFSSLKIRTTYGTVGNSEIGDYDYSQNFTASIYNDGVAYTLSNEGNKNLKWETTTQYNAGIDASFLNDRITITSDIYKNKTNDLLLKVPATLGSGTTEAQLKNVGNVENKGIEFSLTATIIDRNNFSWNISSNIARNSNKITSLGSNSDLTSGTLQESILRKGESVGSFYGLIFNGVVQKDEDVSLLPAVGSTTPVAGDSKFADTNNDNKINASDRVVLGSIQPKFTYGFSTSLTFHGLDLYISFQGSKGNKVYNALRYYLERPNDAYNMSAIFLHSWTENNPSNTVPKIGSTLNSYLDSRYVEDASFLRVKNATLGYTIPLNRQKIPVKLRVFATAQNLYTFTKYKGYDPEIGGGIDRGNYPISRNFSLGVDMSF